MKPTLFVFGVFAIVTTLSPEEDFDANLKAALALFDETTATLKQAKDDKSAAHAAQKIKEINGKLADLKKSDEATFRLSREERDKLRMKYGKKFAPALKALDAEISRCLQKFGFQSPLTKEIEGFKDASAEMDVINEAKASVVPTQIEPIDKAIAAYRAKHRSLPMSLQAMTEGKDALLKQKDLEDPWGQVYRYNPLGPLNDGKKPDVWTEAPSRERIGNWPKEK